MSIGISIGTAVASAAFTAGTVAYAVTAITVSVVASAVVGAAIGGLTSALVGGDIGKGMLYGAIGGAITGGIGAWSELGSVAATGGNVGTGVGSGKEVVEKTVSNIDKSYQIGQTVAPKGDFILKGGVPPTPPSDPSTLLGKVGEFAADNVGNLSTAAATIAGKTIEAAAAGEISQETLEYNAKAAELQNALHEKLAAMSNDTSLAIAGLQAETAQRGQDITAQTAADTLQAQKDEAATERELELQKRERRAGAVSSQHIASATGQLQGPSIREQVYAADGAYA